MYHGIRMKALSIDLVPEVAGYARDLARWYKLPQDQWNIGVDLIVYKDGEDSIGWYADDSQGQSFYAQWHLNFWMSTRCAYCLIKPPLSAPARTSTYYHAI